MELTELNKNDILKHSKEEYPNECCGLIVNINNEQVAIRCKNISENPNKSFIIDNNDVIKYSFDTIIAFYHSHNNNPQFSLADIYFSEQTKKYCVLYCNDNNIFSIYNFNGLEIPYENRPFLIGHLDCFSLFKDYYKRELNLVFKDNIVHPERLNYKFWSTEDCLEKYGKANILLNYFESHGFVKVNNTLKKHDIIIIKLPNIRFPIHILIYLGENKVLHHLNEYSKIEQYSNALKRLTTDIFRHKSLM